MPYLEVACFTPLSALTAILNGADRVELCHSYADGGLTPYESDLAVLLYSLAASSTTPIKPPPLMIMIRPHAQSFVYADTEIADMVRAISFFGTNDAVTGFVFGALTQDGKVDTEQNRRLVDAARGKPCTFHRAFDEIIGQATGRDDEGTGGLRAEVATALDDVISCGFASLLTSGRGPGDKGDSTRGAETIARLQQAARSRLQIIPGGGVRSSNVLELLKTTGTQWVHSSAITASCSAGIEPTADGEEVRRLKEALANLRSA